LLTEAILEAQFEVGCVIIVQPTGPADRSAEAWSFHEKEWRSCGMRPARVLNPAGHRSNCQIAVNPAIVAASRSQSSRGRATRPGGHRGTLRVSRCNGMFLRPVRGFQDQFVYSPGWHLDRNRVSGDRQGPARRLLQLLQLGLPARRLHLQVLWPGLPGTPPPQPLSRLRASFTRVYQLVGFTSRSSGLAFQAICHPPPTPPTPSPFLRV